MKKNKKSDFILVSKSITLVLQIGLTMMVATAIAMLIGYGLDKLFSTKFFMIIFIFIGFGAGMRSVYFMVKKFYDDPDEKKRKDQSEEL